MTKADLVEEVAKVTELTRKDSEVIVDTLFESVIKALRVGDKLEVRGFGSFQGQAAQCAGRPQSENRRESGSAGKACSLFQTE